MKIEKWGDFIKENVAIADYVARFETLHEEGNDFTGGHSTHESRSGRCLKVNQAEGIFHCFNCGAGGSVIDYEMNRIGVDFREACESIAEIMGLELPIGDWSLEERKAYQAQRKQDTDTLSLLGAAADYYYNQITPAVYSYYEDRGFTSETISIEKLGYAPKKDGLKAVLYKVVKGADPEATDNDIRQRLLDTGLYTLNDNGTLKPVFTDRYIFPYWRSKAQIGYLIGRNASGSDTYTRDGDTYQIPKYKKLNTKDSNGAGELPIARHHTLWGAHLLRKDGNPIVITEGIVDALLLRQELGDRYQVISPATTRINNADIDRILDRLWDWGDCYVTLILCNDTEKSGAGAGGALDTATTLQEVWQSRVKAEGEACKEKGTDPPARPTLLLKIAILPCPPELEKIDVADYIQLGLTNELEYWLDSAQSLWCHQLKERRDPKRFFDKSSFLPKLVADELRQQGRYFLHTSGLLYEYQGGVYRDNEKAVKRDIQNILWEQSTDAHVQNVVKHISTGGFIDETDLTASDKINCLNGVLDIDTLELLPHSPYTQSLIQVNTAWDPKAKCPTIERFLGQVLPDDCQDLIREIVGYTLMQSNRFEKAILMVGAGGNGKSTFLNLIRALLGDTNYVSKSLKSLEENRFSVVDLFGKLANICGDMPTSRLEDTSIFKQITSTDAVTGERKFKGSFHFENFATNFFGCNDLPPTSDRTYGFYRRWLVLPFNYEIPEDQRDTQLGEKLKTPAELSGLLRLAVEGQQRLRKKGVFSVSETVEEALKAYQLDNDSMLRFVADEVDFNDSKAVATRSEVYKTYQNYCEDQGVRPVSQIVFNKSLVKNEVATRLDKERPVSWQGISVSHSEFHPDTWGQ